MIIAVTGDVPSGVRAPWSLRLPVCQQVAQNGPASVDVVEWRSANDPTRNRCAHDGVQLSIAVHQSGSFPSSEYLRCVLVGTDFAGVSCGAAADLDVDVVASTGGDVPHLGIRAAPGDIDGAGIRTDERGQPVGEVSGQCHRGQWAPVGCVLD